MGLCSVDGVGEEGIVLIAPIEDGEEGCVITVTLEVGEVDEIENELKRNWGIA
uniref:Uncharacterized protein n=1 Tax=Kalanchoe fedtschenkoi TaxID=63787 RepID=A0A7N1A5B1_KALFE